MYDFALPEVASFIERRKAKLVALQFPEGLVSHANGIIEELERRTGARFIVLADPCYGACDVNLDYSRYADALVHFGHSEMPTLGGDEEVLYVEVRADYDVLSLLPEAERRLHGIIGLVTTAQHIEAIKAVEAALVKDGYEVHVGKGDRRVKHPGQILGCNVSAAKHIESKVDAFLYIGSGDFH
ncbi:MAG TPA: diphthamide synthesis protein, partial [Methanomassiliicoccales archaeon]|nr:diphthamide synthesis protein [Methanomassiliicoccales archaeon]